MDNTLIYIYNTIGDTLKEYQYTTKYNKIPENANIIFIKKGSKVIKYGKLMKSYNNQILEIINNYDKKLYIYPNQFHIFYTCNTSNMYDVLSDIARMGADYFLNKNKHNNKNNDKNDNNTKINKNKNKNKNKDNKINNERISNVMIKLKSKV